MGFELVECDSNGIVLLTHQHLLPGLQHAQAAGQLVDVVPVQKLLLDLADFRHLARHEEMTGTSRRFRYVGRISSTVVVRLPVDCWWIAGGLPSDCRWIADGLLLLSVWLDRHFQIALETIRRRIAFH